MTVGKGKWEKYRDLRNKYNTSPPVDQALKFSISVSTSLAATGDERAPSKDELLLDIDELERVWGEVLLNKRALVDMVYERTGKYDE